MTPDTPSDPQLDLVMGLIQARTGLAFPPSRQPEVEACVRRAMEASRIADAQLFMRRLETDAALFDTLVTSLTVAETYFFREPRQFAFIRQHILPELRGSRGADAGVRVWSAGCATGEEAYSLALLLEDEGLSHGASILATDISGTVLSVARKACYKPWSFRGNDTDAVMRHFHRRNDLFVLEDKFRQRVTFRRLNLAAESYPSLATGTTNIDLILCRNVLIYFDPATVAQVARRLFAALADGGWLITGPSDPPLWDFAPFETKVTEAGVLYRHPARIAALPAIDEPAPSVAHVPDLAAIDESPAIHNGPTEVPPIVPQSFQERAHSLLGDDPSPANDITHYVASIRALADAGQLQPAAALTTTAIEAFPLAAELHYLHAIALTGLGHHDEATASLRRVIYLDPSLAVAHFTLASILWRSGALADARRAYRNALALCTGRPPDERLRLSDDETAGRMAAAIRNQLGFVDDGLETRP